MQVNVLIFVVTVLTHILTVPHIVMMEPGLVEMGAVQLAKSKLDMGVLIYLSLGPSVVLRRPSLLNISMHKES